MERDNKKMVWSKGDITITTKEIKPIEVTPRKLACNELGLSVFEYIEIKRLLTKSELKYLEAIDLVSTAQYILYIKEAIKYLNKRQVLPRKYRHLL